MPKRLTIQGDVNIELMQQQRNSRPPWKHKYVMNRNNSLAAVQRVYIYQDWLVSWASKMRS